MQSRVAVIIAAYNAERTLRQAVESVLSGSQDCDIFFVDDCSRIPVAETLESYDGVSIIRLNKNQGPAAARNIGLSKILAKNYEYVAIMDADDIAMPDRIAKQMEFLKTHPHVAAVGCGAKFVDEHSGAMVMLSRWPIDARAIRNKMFFNIGLFHPTALIRVAVLRAVGLYSDAYPAAEDYELLRRIGAKYDLANLPEYLLAYRVSSQGQSLGRRRRQLFDRLRIQLRYFAPLNWRAWAGVAQSIASLVVPAKFVHTLKLKVLRSQITAPVNVPGFR